MQLHRRKVEKTWNLKFKIIGASGARLSVVRCSSAGGLESSFAAGLTTVLLV